MTKVERTNLIDQLQERVFHIRLKNTQQEVNILSKPNLVKIIEQEYACRYLESLNIEPSQKNINMILKMYPLKNCEITASWKNDSGLYADTITIVTRKKQDKLVQKDKQAKVPSQEMIESLNLKKISEPNLNFSEQSKKLAQQNLEKENQKNEDKEDEKKRDSKEANEDDGQNNDEKIIFQLTYNPEIIKKKYIYPFNQTSIRRMNIGLKDEQDCKLPLINSNNPQDNNEKYLIYESNLFTFPFTQIKLEQRQLKELQKPLTITVAEIKNNLIKFKDSFPQEMIPIDIPNNMMGDNALGNQMKLHHKEISQLTVENEKPIDKKELETKREMDGRYIAFKKYEVVNIFKLLDTEEMARFIGLFNHYAYWIVFGTVNPIQIDQLAKKQMYIMLYELVEYFNTKVVSSKLWLGLGMPMLLLTLKMMSEFIFKNSYPIFFEENSYNQNSAGVIAMDKIFYLIEKMFDETNFFGRFTFLESDFKSLSKQTSLGGGDRKLIRRRLYATSPFMDLMITNPQHGKTRSILAKRHELELREQTKSQNKSGAAFEGLLKKKESSHTSSPARRNDKAIYQDPNEREMIEKMYKQKIVNMVLGKLNSKIDNKINKKNN